MALVKNKNFILVFFGWNISYFGTMLQDFGFSIFVLLTTGSAVKFSITLCIQIIPQVLFAPLSGYVSDRFNRKNLAVMYDFLSAAVVCTALAVYAINGTISIWFIYICIFILSSVNTFNEPVLGCIFQSILEPADFTRAKSANSAVKNAVTLIAPAVAGMIFGLGGIVPIMMLNAFSFLCSALLQCGLRIKKEYIPDSSGGLPLLDSIREGFDYIRKEPFILSFLFTFSVLNFISPVVTVGAPVLAKNLLHLGADGIGFVSSFIAAGFLIGSLLAGLLSSWLMRIEYRKLVFACVCSMMAGLCLFYIWLKAVVVYMPPAANAAVLVLMTFFIVIPEVVMQIHI
jgi:MFS family permease